MHLHVPGIEYSGHAVKHSFMHRIRKAGSCFFAPLGNTVRHRTGSSFFADGSSSLCRRLNERLQVVLRHRLHHVAHGVRFENEVSRSMSDHPPDPIAEHAPRNGSDRRADTGHKRRAEYRAVFHAGHDADRPGHVLGRLHGGNSGHQRGGNGRHADPACPDSNSADESADRRPARDGACRQSRQQDEGNAASRHRGQAAVSEGYYARRAARTRFARIVRAHAGIRRSGAGGAKRRIRHMLS